MHNPKYFQVRRPDYFIQVIMVVTKMEGQLLTGII